MRAHGGKGTENYQCRADFENAKNILKLFYLVLGKLQNGAYLGIHWGTSTFLTSKYPFKCFIMWISLMFKIVICSLVRSDPPLPSPTNTATMVPPSSLLFSLLSVVQIKFAYSR